MAFELPVVKTRKKEFFVLKMIGILIEEHFQKLSKKKFPEPDLQPFQNQFLALDLVRMN